MKIAPRKLDVSIVEVENIAYKSTDVERKNAEIEQHFIYTLSNLFFAQDPI